MTQINFLITDNSSHDFYLIPLSDPYILRRESLACAVRFVFVPRVIYDQSANYWQGGELAGREGMCTLVGERGEAREGESEEGGWGSGEASNCGKWGRAWYETFRF